VAAKDILLSRTMVAEVCEDEAEAVGAKLVRTINEHWYLVDLGFCEDAVKPPFFPPFPIFDPFPFLFRPLQNGRQNQQMFGAVFEL